MKAKLPKKQEQKLKQESDEQQDFQEELDEEEQGTENKHEDIAFFPRMIRKDALFVTFSGNIQCGVFDQYKSLYLHFELLGGPDWTLVSGKRKGMTQTASTNEEKLVWNYPFEATYQTTNLAGWPQLIIVIYGTDFFGKPIIRGYGNVHLPTSSGRQSRKVRMFCPQPQSVLSGILGYFQGCIAEYRDYKKVLTLGDGREVTRTRAIGTVIASVESTKYNFSKFGYE